MTIPNSIEAVGDMLAGQDYVAGRALSTVVFLALTLGKPLFLEGEPGTGKTEIAKAIAAGLGRRLIRLQCYEGLDAASAVYEWWRSARPRPRAAPTATPSRQSFSAPTT